MLRFIKKNFVAKFLLAYLFIMAATVTNVIQLSLTPLGWIGLQNQRRYLVGKLTYLHWIFIPAISHWWSDIRISIYAKPEDMNKFGREKTLLVVNHKCQLDWVVVWVLGLHFNVLQNIKAIVKNSLVFVPIVGWAMWLNEYIFVKRDAKQDGGIIEKSVSNFSSFLYDFWLLIFCEGTRFTAEKQKLSNEIALQKGLKPLKHHLVPRTKGFTLIRSGLNNTVAALYDATVFFPGGKDPTLLNFLNAEDIDVDVMMRRIPISEVPIDEAECSQFVHNLYQEKDQLCEYHEKNGKFPLQGEIPTYADYVKEIVPKTYSSLIIVTLWAAILFPPLIYVFDCVVFSGSTAQAVIGIITLLTVSVTARMVIKSGSPMSSYGKKSA